MPATIQKLQVLADALAAEFSQSMASAQCSSALKRLLPGLEYLSIAVSNPAQAGTIVASSNCAAEGPTTLHLHDPLSSAAGLALSRGQPICPSLLNAAAAKIVPALTDVQQMVLHAPAVTQLLCIPFGHTQTTTEADRSGNVTGNGSGSGSGGQGVVDEAPASIASVESSSVARSGCQLHDALGSGSGALLFGLSEAGSLDARRIAVLTLLAGCLPAPMAQLSADTLSFVNYACGSKPQCACCCLDDSEGDAGTDSMPGSPCSGDRRGCGDGNGGAPSQAFRVPLPAAADNIADGMDHTAGSSALAANDLGDDSQGKKKGSKAAGAAVTAPPLAAPAHAQTAGGEASPYRFPGSNSRQEFSKALVAAAADDGQAIMRQRPISLTFRSPMVEQAYGKWISQYHYKVDLLFSLLLVVALLIVTFIKPYRLVDSALGSSLLGAGMALPLVLNWLSKGMYQAWREAIVVVLRLHIIGFINLVSIRSYQGQLAPERLQQWATFWMLTGAESLCVTAIGFPIRLQMHLPLGLAAICVAAWNLPSMCSECYPAVDAGVCFRSSAAMAAGLGLVLPTVGLRYIEQRSRGIFANRLLSAADHTS